MEYVVGLAVCGLVAVIMRLHKEWKIAKAEFDAEYARLEEEYYQEILRELERRNEK